MAMVVAGKLQLREKCFTEVQLHDPTDFFDQEVEGWKTVGRFRRHGYHRAISCTLGPETEPMMFCRGGVSHPRKPPPDSGERESRGTWHKLLAYAAAAIIPPITS